jgi:YihY family inner membrane protein
MRRRSPHQCPSGKRSAQDPTEGGGATRDGEPDDDSGPAEAARDDHGGDGRYGKKVVVQSVSSETARDTPAPAPLSRHRAELRRVLTGTVAACFRYRVTGLAAEAAFFALLSLPPLLLGLVGTLGYFADILGAGTIDRVEGTILRAASVVLSERGVSQVVAPTLDNILGEGRVDITVAGAVIALWSGSRALNVYVDTITIAYGLGGRRGIIRTRVLSFTLYLIGLVLGIVLLPLVVAGPQLVTRVFPYAVTTVQVLYWPVVTVLSVAFLATLYHLSVPVRTPWRTDLPGAVLALVIWVAGSFLLRFYLGATIEGPSVYGSLAAPVAVLLWLYVTALAVLIGAALNAEVDRTWVRRGADRAGSGGPVPTPPAGSPTAGLPPAGPPDEGPGAGQDVAGRPGTAEPRGRDDRPGDPPSAPGG